MSNKDMRNNKRQTASRGVKATEKLTPKQRAVIHKAVKKVVDQYGETLRMLGQE